MFTVVLRIVPGRVQVGPKMVSDDPEKSNPNGPSCLLMYSNGVLPLQSTMQGNQGS